MTDPTASSALGTFVWYDQMSNDLPGAEAFYTKAIGWTLAPNTMNAQRYTLLKAGDAAVGGLMPIPEDAAKMGARPAWMGYIAVDDVKAFADKVKAAGGAIHRPPTQIPNVGTFAIASDPHGAGFILFKGNSDERADAGSRAARPRRLARTACGRPGDRLRLLFGPVRLEEGRGDGHGSNGDLPDLLDQRPAGRRHDDQDGSDASAVLALLLHCRCDRRGGGAGQVRGRPDRQWPDAGSRRTMDRARPRSAGRDVRDGLAEALELAAMSRRRRPSRRPLPRAPEKAAPRRRRMAFAPSPRSNAVFRPPARVQPQQWEQNRCASW